MWSNQSWTQTLYISSIIASVIKHMQKGQAEKWILYQV